jgi:hypothetical protein
MVPIDRPERPSSLLALEGDLAAGEVGTSEENVATSSQATLGFANRS